VKGLAWARAVRLGAQSLLLHKLRASLTTLGVLFGVSSVVAMLSIGEGASWEAQEQIRQLGSTNILMRSVKPPDEVRGTERAVRVSMHGLTYLDLERVEETLPDLLAAVPIRELRHDVRAGERVSSPRVLATLPSYLKVSGRLMQSGRFLCEEDHIQAASVCVLSGEVADHLFPFETPLEQIVKIGGDYFRVVGTLLPRATAGTTTGRETSGEVFISFRTARDFFGKLVVKNRPGSREMEQVELHEIVAQVSDIDRVERVAAAAREMLRRYHDKADYEVVVPLELLQRARETRRIFNIVLGSIAGISLLVGGIGIMNVMLATVTERTREIGIRRAIGAKRRHIVSQFLVETVVLSMTGGVLGILLGIAIPLGVERFTDLKTIVTPAFPAVAFGISVAVGVIFGLYPAWRAATMNPVEALRHE
jgi:putative ABC transport system permease protein